MKLAWRTPTSLQNQFQSNLQMLIWGWKLIKTARGTPWKSFFAQKIKWLENCRKDSIWPGQPQARIVVLANTYLILYEFSKNEMIFVWLARKMTFPLENRNIARKKALEISLEDSYKSAESISIKFANVDFGLKIDKNGKGYPLENFFRSKNKLVWTLQER